LLLLLPLLLVEVHLLAMLVTPAGYAADDDADGQLPVDHSLALP
jgi:hypothetical protein